MEQQEKSDGVKPETQVISPQELADMVKLLRGGRNWSQEQLAEISGLTVRTIQRIERGEASNFDTRRALARARDGWASRLACIRCVRRRQPMRSTTSGYCEIARVTRPCEHRHNPNL